MPADWPIALALILGLIVLFAAAIFFAVRLSGRQQQKALQETNAETVWAAAPKDVPDRSGLLYGVWEVSWQAVVMVVRDQRDEAVGTITKRTLNTTIDSGGTVYRSVPRMTWRGGADLVADGRDGSNPASAICSFRLAGGIGHRVAQYTVPGYGVIEIPIRYAWPWKRSPTLLVKDGQPIGELFTIGAPARNDGRALVLPQVVPLPARLFILHTGAGPPARTR
ncbi:MAG TPA: hypothetical protein VKE50_00070 [Thermoanaerobaculia bacterium]|nr:hypothetical protein [Thermoanaerobaculia bacterium]